MTAVLQSRALSKRYGHRTALSNCTLSIPAGRVVGLVGMLVVVLALTVSLTLDSPLPLLVGVGVMALTQLAAYVFGPTHRHAELGET